MAFKTPTNYKTSMLGHVVNPVEPLEVINLAHNTAAMKRRMIGSLHWYVHQSVTDMLEDFMQSDDNGGSAERQQILSEMCDLPLNFDETSRQLVVTQILETVQREVRASKKKCMELMIGLLRKMDYRRSDVANLLLKDFEMLVDHTIFGDTDNESTRDVSSGSADTSDQSENIKSEFARLKEALALVKILIKISLGFSRNKKVPILVLLNKLSEQKPNAMFANILISMLKEVAPSLIDDETRRNGDYAVSRNSMNMAFVQETPTIDNVLRRVSAFYRYVLPSHFDNLAVVKKIVEAREKMKKLKNGNGRRIKMGYIDRELYLNDFPRTRNCDNDKDKKNEASTSF